MAYDPTDTAWWKDALDGKAVRIHADQPMRGFYAYRRRKEDRFEPVAIWYGNDRELKCKIGDASVKYGIDIWPNVARNPISYEVYQSVMAGEPWPNEIRFTDATGNTQSTQGETQRGAGDNSGKTNPVLDDIVEWTARAKAAKAKGAPKTKEDADAIGDLATKLHELNAAANEERLSLTRPLLDQQRSIKASYDKFIDPAAVLVADLKRMVNEFIAAEKKRRAEEIAKIQKQAEEAGVDATVQAAPVRVGTRGKSISQVQRSFVVIDDVAKAAAYFAGMKEPPAEFVEAIKKNAYRILQAGADVPGAHLEKTTEAR